MKLLFSISFILVSFISFSQVKQEIRKEVEVEEENGQKVVTIKTTSNGSEKIEVF